MTNQPLVSLMTYLQHGLEEVDVIDHGPHNNTRNRAYRAADIQSFDTWHEFNINTIWQRFGEILSRARIPDHAQHDSPRRMINSEHAVAVIVQEWVSTPIRRALRTGFRYNNSHEVRRHLNLTRISNGTGSMAKEIDGYRPDLSFFNDNIPDPGQRANRAPGDVKPSYKWSLELSLSNRTITEFKQALSQVNWYMKQHHTRYGFILTNQELVAIRRLNEHGNLELSASIPWTAHGTARNPVMTVLLGMWYLGMLASVDQPNQLPGLQVWGLF